uniref:Chitin deacetylase 2 n=1 Tax=Podosphaera xanthii TaxID=135283 RepID=A0A6S4IDJ3_9PEZI|nr:chitin deacetylase 2 [Podosphaera xanthii]
MQMLNLARTVFTITFFYSIISAQNTCGPSIGSCAANECCSSAGNCGTTSDHCAAPGCQTEFGPACDANKTPLGLNTSSIPRGKLGSVLYGGGGIYACNSVGDVALTFDDGPSQYTGHVLDLLDQYQAKATFFVTGINNGKGAIDTTNTSGHQIASHSWSHADLSKISQTQRRNEMIKNEMALRNILGVIPTYMRPPYSSCTAESGCTADMEDLGYHVTYFDLDTQDYLNDSPDKIEIPKNIFDRAIGSKSPTNGDFLAIAHDIHEQTSSQLVEHMLQGLRSSGYRAVTVGTCLGDPKENWYRPGSSTLGFRMRT